MNLSKDLNENIFYRILNFTYWFLLTNIYFFLFTIPFWLVVQLFWDPANLFSWGILLVSLLPLGPALTAVFSVMGKLHREKTISITKDYFTAVKENMRQALLPWTIHLLITSIVTADIIFLTDHEIGSYITPLCYLILITNAISSLYLYPILSRLEVPLRGLFKLAYGYTLFNIKTTLILISMVAVTGILIYIIPFISLFFIIGPFCYGVMWIMKSIIQELEKKLIV
ncbi:DUF624 domain-containing protein [Rossellomorea vietnamensis]|uniref:DUF624 domain-containing protein n=1 Tax=Rossellomorea vietnamensis TaxID=218284 RepID=A0ACD4C455_9BACI|nr:DUF624 domain-containing protein [Rossellomorea vietnamensis]UXH43202.1 DUF624 domain-containing protein [Rossellomorea vietnamensis]